MEGAGGASHQANPDEGGRAADELGALKTELQGFVSGMLAEMRSGLGAVVDRVASLDARLGRLEAALPPAAGAAAGAAAKNDNVSPSSSTATAPAAAGTAGFDDSGAADLSRLERPNTDDELIKVDVGGTVFKTRLSTLCRVPGSFLEVMFSGRHRVSHDEEGAVFIDRSAHYFGLLLEWLRDPSAPHRLPFYDRLFVHELRYYGVAEEIMGEAPDEASSFRFLYAIGGGTEADFLRTAERFSIETRAWTPIAGMPTPRDQFGCTTVDGVIYCVGGESNNQQVLDVVECYDPSKDAWATRSPMPTPRRGVVCAQLGGMLVAVGGFNGDDFVDRVECYDTISDTWVQLSPIPTPRIDAGVAVLNGRLYVVGGFYGDDPLSTVECYDPETNSWETKTSMHTERDELGCVAYGGRLYAAGGRDHNFNLDIVESYDPEKDEWTYMAPMGTGRRRFGLAVLEEKLYAVAGLDCSGLVLRTAESYNPETNTWDATEPLAEARDAPGVTAGA